MDASEFQGRTAAHLETLARGMTNLEAGQAKIFDRLDEWKTECASRHLDLEKRMPRNGNGKSAVAQPPVVEEEPARKPMSGAAKAAWTIGGTAAVVTAILEGLPRVIAAISAAVHAAK